MKNNKKGSATAFLIIALLVALAIIAMIIKLNWARFKAETSFAFTMIGIVLAVILPETDRSTDVTVLDVLQNGNSVIFNYHVERGEKNSYRLVPFAAVSLPKPRTTQNMEFYFNKK